jgi:hypothetical protein
MLDEGEGYDDACNEVSEGNLQQEMSSMRTGPRNRIYERPLARKRGWDGFMEER